MWQTGSSIFVAEPTVMMFCARCCEVLSRARTIVFAEERYWREEPKGSVILLRTSAGHYPNDAALLCKSLEHHKYALDERT